MKKFLAIGLLALGCCTPWPRPPIDPDYHVDQPPSEPTSCEEHPEPYKGDIPCGFVDGIPVGG